MDQLKERIRSAIWNAGLRNQFVTATEMVREFHVESADPIRTIKKKIEELRNEECPIVGLPGNGQMNRQGRQGRQEERDGTSTDYTDSTDCPGREPGTKNLERLGPGYTWVHDPGSEWGRRVIGRFDADIGHRIREMVRHRAVLTRMSVNEAQRELFGPEEHPQITQITQIARTGAEG